jgi:hypothetical protein
VDKNGSSKSKIEKYEIPLSILLQYLGWCWNTGFAGGGGDISHA